MSPVVRTVFFGEKALKSYTKVLESVRNYKSWYLFTSLNIDCNINGVGRRGRELYEHQAEEEDYLGHAVGATVGVVGNEVEDTVIIVETYTCLW